MEKQKLLNQCVEIALKKLDCTYHGEPFPIDEIDLCYGCSELSITLQDFTEIFFDEVLKFMPINF